MAAGVITRLAIETHLAIAFCRDFHFGFWGR
jgi:hypothetical protein